MSDPVRATTKLSEPGRVEAFSDGVLAIAITLLVLDLRPPEARGDFLHDLLAEWPAYLAYVAAFVIIGALWQTHHALFARVVKVDTWVVGRNMVVLLATSVMPFPTAVVSSAWRTGDRSDQVAALGLFAFVSISMSAAWISLCRYLAQHGELLEDEAALAWVANEPRRSTVAIAMVVVTFPISFVAPVVTLVAYAVTPVFYLVTLHRIQRADA